MDGRQRVIFVKLSYILFDIFFVGLSIFVACWIRQETLPFPIGVRQVFLDNTNPYQLVFFFWLFSILFFNNAYGLYQTRRELLESVEVWQVVRSIIFSSVLTIVALYTFKIEGFPRSILLLGGLLMIAFLSVWRVLKRMFVEFLVVRGYNNFNILIIGAGKVGVALAREIQKHPAYGLKVAGFLDDFKINDPEKPQMHILGKISEFPEIARREFINKIFITIHHDSRVFLQLLEQARELRVAVRVVPQGFEFTTGEFSKYNIGFIPVLEYCDEDMVKQAGKRLFDFISSLILLIFLSPLFLVIMVLIKIDSPGPIFYLSKRYGRRGKLVNMYKFRSMFTGADQQLKEILAQNEVDGPIFKIKDDPRVTALGRFLRRYSLDELPQLLNVLKGDMSLVGPRPLPIEQIEKEDIRQLKRLEVRPGITGLWQIRGRSDISFVRLVKWDIWYINNWSFWLDLNILLQTIPIVMKGKGAY